MSTAIFDIEKKKTLVPQLRFPGYEGEWELKKLGELSDLITKGTTPKRFVKNGIRFIKLECFEGDRINPNKCLFIDGNTHNKELKRSILLEGDILFAIAGATIGKVNIVNNEILPANTNQALSIVRLKVNENKEFVYHNLKSDKMRKYILDNISVGAQPNLNLEQMNNFSFFLPTLPEQQKIASFLNTVDEKIRQLSRKKELLEQYKKGVMQQLFSGKLRFKDENGEDYADWEDKKLGNLGVFKGGGTPSTENSEYWDGDIPWISSSDLIENDILNINVTRFITEKAISESATKLIPANSVLFISRVGVGKLAVSKRTMCTSQDFANFIPNEIDSFYLAYYFIKNNNLLSSYAQGTSIKGFTSGDLKSIKVSYPVLEEQQKIANFLSSIDVKIESVNQQLAQTQTFKKGLLQQMFV